MTDDLLEAEARRVLTWGVGNHIGAVARDMASEVLALLERVRKAEARVALLQSKGGLLANAAYNLKQQDYIPEQHRRSLDESQRAWDVVLAGGDMPTTSPARRPMPPPERTMAVAAAEARKFGAEEMRKDVAAFVEDASIPLPIENWRGTKRELTAHFARALAERIRQMPLPDGPAPTADARVALLAQQVVDALNECDHGGGGTPVGCAACEPMLAAMRKAGVELEDMATSWPYWRLRS